jgi:hypothetical protein
MNRAISHRRPASAFRPQFHLRTLLLAVTGCCVVFYLMRLIGPLGSIMLTVGLSLAGLHVFGNALGTSLSEQAENQIDPLDEPLVPPPKVGVAATAAGPPGTLHDRKSLGWRIIVLTLLGAAAGAAGGAWAYIALANATEAGVIVGSVSTAILGGFLSFLTSSFLLTFLGSIRE